MKRGTLRLVVFVRFVVVDVGVVPLLLLGIVTPRRARHALVLRQLVLEDFTVCIAPEFVHAALVPAGWSPSAANRPEVC